MLIILSAVVSLLYDRMEKIWTEGTHFDKNREDFFLLEKVIYLLVKNQKISFIDWSDNFRWELWVPAAKTVLYWPYSPRPLLVLLLSLYVGSKL